MAVNSLRRPWGNSSTYGHAYAIRRAIDGMDAGFVLASGFGVAPGPSGQGQEQQLIAARFGEAVGFYILLPANTDVRPEDRIYQLTPFVRTFEVLAIPNKQISFETLRRVLGVVIG